jgi:prepilin signal peptidase PulO-like enzyme (type II secretory pathway)
LFVPVTGGLLDWLLRGVPLPLHWLIAALFCAAAFALPFWFLGYLYERFRQPEAFGLGDVKLLAMLGIFLGWAPGVLAIFIGAVGGAAFGVGYALITRQSMRTTSLPFGAFLCAGAAVVPLVSKL